MRKGGPRLRPSQFGHLPSVSLPAKIAPKARGGGRDRRHHDWLRSMWGVKVVESSVFKPCASSSYARALLIPPLASMSCWRLSCVVSCAASSGIGDAHSFHLTISPNIRVERGDVGLTNWLIMPLTMAPTAASARAVDAPRLQLAHAGAHNLDNSRRET